MNDLQAITTALVAKPLSEIRRALDALVALGKANIVIPGSDGDSNWSGGHEYEYTFEGVTGHGGTRDEAAANWFKCASRAVFGDNDPSATPVQDRLRTLLAVIPVIAVETGLSTVAISGMLIRQLVDGLADIDRQEARALALTLEEMLNPPEMRCSSEAVLGAEYDATIARIEAIALRGVAA